jgi:hypothetical protein
MKCLLILGTVLALSGTSDDVQCGDALKEVNHVRAKHGLRPFRPDDKLAEGAMAAANYRARRLIAGHTSNDFHYLPKGARATAAGCAAWPRGEGWGACCTYENWRYAGAAWVLGRDGKRYMHLFVR